MDSTEKKALCNNCIYGCTFSSSCEVDMVRHFQWDCPFHPVRCFKCNTTVRRVNFEKHYVGCCKDNSAPPCPAPEENRGVEEAEAIRMMSREQRFLQECVKDCTLGVETLINIMNNAANEIAKVEELKAKQQELEATVKGQGNVIQELSKTITMLAEKVNKVQEDAGSLLREVGTLTRRQAGQSTIHWYLQNFSKYVEKAKKEESDAESDMFVLHGYSAKLLFKVNHRNSDPSIGLYFCLCRGPNDSLLQWPFRTPYTLSLVHPKDASKSETFKITPPSTGAKSFRKREDDVLCGYGIGSLCTIKTAQDEGFIEDDAVCFSVTLHE